jgi:hypothetical protein
MSVHISDNNSIQQNNNNNNNSQYSISPPMSDVSTNSYTHLSGIVQRAKASLASDTNSSAPSTSSESGSNSPHSQMPSESRKVLTSDFMSRRLSQDNDTPSQVTNIRSSFDRPTDFPSQTLPRRLPGGSYILHSTLSPMPDYAATQQPQQRFLPDVSQMANNFEKVNNSAKIEANIKLGTPKKMILKEFSPTENPPPTSSGRQTWLSAVNDRNNNNNNKSANVVRNVPIKLIGQSESNISTPRTISLKYSNSNAINTMHVPKTNAARELIEECGTIDLNSLRGKFVFDIDLNSNDVIMLNRR